MRKTTSQMQVDWIEDTEYGTLAPTEEVSDDNEFKEKLTTYRDAQAVKEMSVTVGWLILKRELVEETQRRDQELLHCNDDNEEKLKRLKRNQREAAHMRDWVTDFVENAKDTPQPIKVKS